MRTFFLAVAIAATSFTVSAQLTTGDNLPESGLLKNALGKSVTLKDASGANGLLVMFSCNTCPYVIRNAEVTRKTIEFARMHHVGMIIVNSNEAKRSDDDSYEAMATYGKSQQYPVPYVVDENSKLADIFGANHTPEIFLFNSSGKLVYKGAMNDNPGDPANAKQVYIEEAINAMITGREINPSTTKSVGCSIKRKA